MIIDLNFFDQTHSCFKDVSKEYLLPNLGNLEKDQISEKSDNSLVTQYDLIIENELIEYFKEKGFANIILSNLFKLILGEITFIIKFIFVFVVLLCLFKTKLPKTKFETIKVTAKKIVNNFVLIGTSNKITAGTKKIVKTNKFREYVPT